MRPSRAQKNPRTGHRTVLVWPKEQKEGDRIEEQLMFVPPKYQYDEEPMKKILLYNGLSNWMVDDGQGVFVSKQCPVDRCLITTKKSEAPDVDAILFRDHFSHPGHRKSAKQVRWKIVFKSFFFPRHNGDLRSYQFASIYIYCVNSEPLLKLLVYAFTLLKF